MIKTCKAARFSTLYVLSLYNQGYLRIALHLALNVHFNYT